MGAERYFSFFRHEEDRRASVEAASEFIDGLTGRAAVPVLTRYVHVDDQEAADRLLPWSPPGSILALVAPADLGIVQALQRAASSLDAEEAQRFAALVTEQWAGFMNTTSAAALLANQPDSRRLLATASVIRVTYADRLVFTDLVLDAEFSIALSFEKYDGGAIDAEAFSAYALPPQGVRPDLIALFVARPPRLSNHEAAVNNILDRGPILALPGDDQQFTPVAAAAVWAARAAQLATRAAPAARWIANNTAGAALAQMIAEFREAQRQEKAQQERLNRENVRAERDAAEVDQAERNRAENNRRERERQERERQERQRQERDRQERERQERDRQERERQERDRQRRAAEQEERMHRDNVAAEERQRHREERAEADRRERERQERERQERERQEREQQEREQQEHAAQERERQEAERQERDQQQRQAEQRNRDQRRQQEQQEEHINLGLPAPLTRRGFFGTPFAEELLKEIGPEPSIDALIAARTKLLRMGDE